MARLCASCRSKAIHNVSTMDKSREHKSANSVRVSPVNDSAQNASIPLRTLALHSERRHCAQNAGTALRTPAPHSTACPRVDCTPCSCVAGTYVSHRTSASVPRRGSNTRSSGRRSPSDNYSAARDTPPGCHGDSNGRSSRRLVRPTSSRRVALERRSISPTRSRRTTKHRSWSRIGPGTHDRFRHWRSASINHLSRLQICVYCKYNEHVSMHDRFLHLLQIYI